MGLRLDFVFLNWIASLLDRPIERIGPEASRAQIRKNVRGPAFILGTPPDDLEVRDEVLAGVRVRRYRPRSPGSGTVVYFHGGGWVVGDLDTHDTVCRRLCVVSQREVVAVDYRLAPEHPFPAAIDDAFSVTRELARLGPVVVAGDSAGGHLAAVMARRCAKEASPLAGQLLVYPVTDCAAESGSYQRFHRGYFLTRDTMRYFRDAFVPDPGLRSHPDASPLTAPPIATCPAYVLLAECDVLHDEGLAYAEKLRAEGTTVTVDEVAGVIHGFFSFQGLALSRAALERAAAFVQHRLA